MFMRSFGLLVAVVLCGCGSSSPRFPPPDQDDKDAGVVSVVLPALAADPAEKNEDKDEVKSVFVSTGFGSMGEISLPIDWNIGQIDDHFVAKRQDNVYTVVVIEGERPDGIEPADFGKRIVLKLLEDDAESVIAVRPKNIAGQQGAFILMKTDNITMLRYAFATVDTAYVLTCGSPTETKIIPTCTKILDTFRFVGR